MRRSRMESENGPEGWLLTLNDLLFLLLTFFVLLFSTLDFSSPGNPTEAEKSPETSEEDIRSFEEAKNLMSSILDEPAESVDRHREARFRDGSVLRKTPEGLLFELPLPFIDGELPFRTVTLLRVAERLATEQSYFIELQTFSQKNAAQNLIRCGRQILDAGFPGERISGYGRDLPQSGGEELLRVSLRSQNSLS